MIAKKYDSRGHWMASHCIRPLNRRLSERLIVDLFRMALMTAILPITTLLSLTVLSTVPAMAQSRPMLIHPKNMPAEGQMDENPVFTIQETKRHYVPADPKPAQGPEHGIVGLDLLIRGGTYPLVQSVFRGTPARNAGILPGDRVVAVDGIRADGKTLPQVDAMISDVPGDVVTFTLLRNDELRTVRVTVVALQDVAANLRANFAGLFPNND